MGRPPLYDDALRERLINVTAERTFADGFAAVSLRQVAAAAGTTTAAVYTLFGDKAGLHRAIFVRAVDMFAAKLAKADADSVSDVIEVIVQRGLAYRRAALEDPHGYQIMFGGGEHPGVVESEVFEKLSETFTPLVGLVERAIAEGRLVSDPGAAEIATAMWANVHGLVSIEIKGALPLHGAAIERLAEESIRRSVACWRA